MPFEYYVLVISELVCAQGENNYFQKIRLNTLQMTLFVWDFDSFKKTDFYLRLGTYVNIAIFYLKSYYSTLFCTGYKIAIHVLVRICT